MTDLAAQILAALDRAEEDVRRCEDDLRYIGMDVRVLALVAAVREVVTEAQEWANEDCRYGRCSCAGVEDAQQHWLAKAADHTLAALASAWDVPGVAE